MCEFKVEGVCTQFWKIENTCGPPPPPPPNNFEPKNKPRQIMYRNNPITYGGGGAFWPGPSDYRP